MAASKITNTITIVDPFDELSDIAAANERVQAGLRVLSDRMADVIYGSLDAEAKVQRMRDGWLLLELIRESHITAVSERVRVAETAFFEFTDAIAVQNKVEALRAAA